MAKNENPLEEVVVRVKKVPGQAIDRDIFGYPEDGGGVSGIGGGGDVSLLGPDGNPISEITPPTAEEMGLDKCGPGTVRVNVTRGATTYSGCATFGELTQFLNTGGDISKISPDSTLGTRIINEATAEKLKEWNELKEAYENGEATLQDLKDFDPGVLSGLGGWLDDYDNFISGEEEEGKKLQELIEKYGEDVVRDMQNKYDELVDFIGNVPEDPLGSLQKMIEVFVEGATGVPPECTASGGPAGTALPEWIRNCVTVGVLVDIGIPGLPGGLGSVFKGVTVGELEEGLKNIGKKFEDIINGTPTCGEEGDQECTPEQILEDLGDWVVNSVKDIFGNEEDEITIESILGKLGGIFGGVLGGIIYGEFKDLINGEIEDVIGVPVLPFNTNPDCESKGLETIDAEGNCGNCKQPGFVFDKDLQKCVDPNAAEPFDETQCTEQGYFEQNKAACEAAGYVDCEGAVGPDGEELTGGIIKGSLLDCGVIQDPQCSDVGTYNPETGNCDCPEGYEFEVETGGTCGAKDTGDVTPEEIDCTQPRPGYTPSFNPADNEAYFAWQEKCGETHCPSGTLKSEDPYCGEEPPEQPEKECTDPNRQKNTDGSCGECNQGFKLNEEGLCQKEEVVEEPEPTETPYEPDCSQPRPFGLITFDLIDQQRAWDKKCGGQTGPSPCDQQDRVTNEDGSCGPCKPGFVEDPQGFDQCIRAPQECNDCSCAEYAAANPQECGETPTETTETGGGASVGGGAGGAFSPFLAGITYTPQPVPEIIQQQSGMFTGAQPTRNTKLVGDSIIQNIFKEYFV